MAKSYSGLSLRERQRARRMAKEAALLTLHHAPVVHYTQGSRRWDGINNGYRAWKGEYPRYADCSAMATWWLWQGLGHYHLPDIVNGESWHAGYTGTMLEHGKHVSRRGGNPRLKVGDCVLYGIPGSTGKHVAMVVKVGGVFRRRPYVVSHGSEGGPYLLPWDYRSDVMAIRRYI